MRKLAVLLVAFGALWLAPGAFAAWCGGGETGADLPDVVTGPQIHAIYVVPANAPDTFATGSQQLANDVASITSWWQGQDPTRVPRFDQAVYPGGTCTDISFVRLSSPSSALLGANRAFSLVGESLFNDGFDNPWKKYLVYYAGPSVEPGICGTGGGTFDSGPSFAVVWLQGCTDVPSDAVAAHELLHALGALPAGAPNACTPATDPAGVADSAHPCDSSTDVLYPYSTPGVPLANLVLDYNHDDYYAHSGSWIDIQDSAWLHLLNALQVPLSVSLTGAGAVQSAQPGLTCSSACTTSWDQGSAVTLTAAPTANTRFVRWGGACAGVGAGVCDLTLQSAQSVTAVFGPAKVGLKLSTAGRGSIYCVPRCATTIKAGSLLSLIAQPGKGWTFVRWSGSCKGSQPVCHPVTGAAVAAKATFRKKPKPKKR